MTFGGGSFAPATVAPGATTTASITLTASCQSTGLVDFEVYNAAGHKVWRSWQDKASLSESAQTFSARWSVPASQAAGAYTLKIGVFSPG